jgi:hypothetical protein
MFFCKLSRSYKVVLNLIESISEDRLGIQGGQENASISDRSEADSKRRSDPNRVLKKVYLLHYIFVRTL